MNEETPRAGGHRLPAHLAKADPSKPVEAAGALTAWLREAPVRPREGHEPERTGRLRAALLALETDPSLAALRQALAGLLSVPSAVRIFAEIGLPEHSSLGKEAVHRLADRLLPVPHDEGDLYGLLASTTFSEEEAAWVAALPDDLVLGLAPLLPVDRGVLTVAARLAAQRAAAVGLGRDILALEPESAEGNSPFLDLPRLTRELSEAPASDGLRTELVACVSRCRARLFKALARLEERGANSDLIYRLELLEALLARLSTLVALATEPDVARAREFAAEVVRGVARQRSLTEIYRSSVQRLARKVVEHTGETGEHYVSWSREEYRATGVAASGGGALTAVTAALKFGLHALPFAPFFEGVAYSLNYAISFVAMQLFGLTLASKQPAMTASALAASLEDRKATGRVVEMTAGIVRTQTISTVGNVFVAIPAGLLLDGAWHLLAGAPMLSSSTAAESVASFHPFRTWSLLFAAVTGILLWVGSLVAGLVANWAAFRRLPDGIRSSVSIRRLLGPRRAEKAARFAAHDLGGLAGNVALGFLLGFTPTFLHFFGVGFEVRHVTLSAASIGIAAGRELAAGTFTAGPFAWALGGVLLIGVLNILVSFALALATAARARGLDPSMRGRVQEALWAAFKADPSKFLVPPRAEPG